MHLLRLLVDPSAIGISQTHRRQLPDETLQLRQSSSLPSVTEGSRRTERDALAFLFSYLLIPFLLELRTIMDWIFTDTALGLSSWLQLEDIYSNVYLLKCARWAEKVR